MHTAFRPVKSDTLRFAKFVYPRLLRRVLGVLAIAASLIGPARATTVKAPEFSGLVNQSDFIVRAVVKSVTSEIRQGTKGRKIYTHVELEVREVIAGKPPTPLVLVLLGGKVGDDTMVIEGAPTFQVGDEDILFVQGNGRQIYPLVAMMHGKYPVEKEPESGREFMLRSNKVPLKHTAEVSQEMAEGTEAQAQAAAINTAEALTPQEFVRQIQAAVKSENSRLNER